MKKSEINIRDPFVLLFEDKYYMYGTRGASCWGEATGFDCYVSDDLENWSEPIEVFKKPKDFWADKNCWAPEVHLYNGDFYMFATFKDSEKIGGTSILKADNPLGPFIIHGEDKITPKDWECIDGTFYLSSEGVPYMIFVHEWVQISDGSICLIELDTELKKAVSDPITLFCASEAKDWIKPFYQEKRPGKHYVTDGPCIYTTKNGRLVMLWSSFGDKGYTEALCYSESGDIHGPWIHDERLLFEKDGGHGMIFKTRGNELVLTLHSPNKHLEERPIFYYLEEKENTLWLKDKKIKN